MRKVKGGCSQQYYVENLAAPIVYESDVVCFLGD